SIKNLWQFFHQSNEKHHKETGDEHHFDETGNEKEVGPKSFWGTVFKVEVADIAFAIDSMLAALAIAVTLPKVGIHFGGMDLGQFIVM
ncbi:TerC family protein, partial [Staphylococcus lugdunensis]|uniref:TerC family protein n=1 Tax=Staphylococcus lugdunensis TaxID=28035 RepID=UPI0030C54373